MNFYQRYPGDYMRDTGHLSLMEHGVYAVLLDHYYASEKPLSSSWASLFRLCRATTQSERDAVTSVIEEFFVLQDDDRYHNPRADEELEKRLPQIEHNRANGVFGHLGAEHGSKGGRPRKTPKVGDTETPNRGLKITPQKPPIPDPERFKSNDSVSTSASASPPHICGSSPAPIRSDLNSRGRAEENAAEVRSLAKRLSQQKKV